MEGVAIGLAIGIERELGDRDHEDRRARRPLLIVFAEATQQSRVLGFILLGGHNEVPGLLISSGSRPAGRFPEAQQLLGLDWAMGEGARTPASLQQFLDGIGRVSQFLHLKRSSQHSMWLIIR